MPRCLLAACAQKIKQYGPFSKVVLFMGCGVFNVSTPFFFAIAQIFEPDAQHENVRAARYFSHGFCGPLASLLEAVSGFQECCWPMRRAT
jgi:hypothetical protein